MTTRSVWLGRLTLFGAVLLVGAVTLLPTSERGASALSPWCLWCGQFATVDLIMNTLLFVPFGIALGALRVKVGSALLLVMGTTVAIEALQFAFIDGRDANPADVLTNGVGGLLGILLASKSPLLRSPTAAAARRLLVIWGSVWIAGRGATAVLMLPAPSCGPWWAQISPHLVYPATFDGNVLEAQLDGHLLINGRMPEDRTACERFSRHGVSLKASVLNGGPSAAVASLASIGATGQSEVILLGQDGASAKFRVRLLAADARLRLPSLSMPDGLSAPRGETLSVSGSLASGALTLITRSASGTERTATLRLGAGLGWALLLPFDVGLPPSAVWITALWTFVWIVPLGFWWRAATATRPGSSVGSILLALLAGFLVPMTVSTSAAPFVPELLAAILGVLGGAWLRDRLGLVSRGAAGESSTQ